MKKQITKQEGEEAVALALSGDEPSIATATRYLLQETAKLYPGGSVELRVPPFGAVQCVEGLSHNRGTPPNVVELDPTSWILLATGKASFASLKESGKLSASGSRSDLSELFPIFSA